MVFAPAPSQQVASPTPARGNGQTDSTNRSLQGGRAAKRNRQPREDGPRQIIGPSFRLWPDCQDIQSDTHPQHHRYDGHCATTGQPATGNDPKPERREESAVSHTATHQTGTTGPRTSGHDPKPEEANNQINSGAAQVLPQPNAESATSNQRRSYAARVTQPSLYSQDEYRPALPRANVRRRQRGRGR